MPREDANAILAIFLLVLFCIFAIVFVPRVIEALCIAVGGVIAIVGLAI